MNLGDAPVRARGVHLGRATTCEERMTTVHLIGKCVPRHARTFNPALKMTMPTGGLPGPY
jgi:hypothetical protein